MLAVTKQIQDLYKLYPKVFEGILLRSEQEVNQAEASDRFQIEIASSIKHSNIKVSDKIDRNYCRDLLNLPVSSNKIPKSLRQSV